MGEIERFLIYVAVGAAAGCLLAIIRYGREAVRLLASMDDRLDRRQ